MKIHDMHEPMPSSHGYGDNLVDIMKAGQLRLKYLNVGHGVCGVGYSVVTNGCCCG